MQKLSVFVVIKVRNHIIIIIAGLLSAIMMPAQNLPILKADASVKTDSLPNGMRYYLVQNPSIKGYADFVLVQRVGSNMSDSTAVLSRRTLAQSKRFNGRSPQEVMVSLGCFPEKDGFVSVKEEATVFRFENVMLKKHKNVLDSALLVLMDMADRYISSSDTLQSEYFVPENQAVIISGDIDTSLVRKKLLDLSLMLPAKQAREKEEKEWESRSAELIIVREQGSELASIEATWCSPAIPREQMNTVQPLIYEMFMEQLGVVLSERIKSGLASKVIPVADISYEYESITDSSDQESFTISLTVAEEDLEEASEVFISAIGAVKTFGPEVDETRYALQVYLDGLRDGVYDPVKPNSYFVNQCVSAYLYNTSLASMRSRLNFHTSRNLGDTVRTRLLHNVSSALIDADSNFVLTCRTPDFVRTKEDFSQMFYSEWGNAVADDSRPEIAPLPELDSVLFTHTSEEKSKVDAIRKEPVSEGTIWTMKNGLQVVYKKMDTNDKLYYSLALNGGYASVPDLEKGEGAYFSDYPWLCRIGDVPGEDFRKMLRLEGISIESSVNLSNAIISGKAPNDKLETLFRTLLTFLYEMEPDQESFAYYKKCEDLKFLNKKGGRQERIAAIDSIMCPGNVYSAYKSENTLTEDFFPKAEQYFKDMGSKINDGVLVILGDVDETSLKKLLVKYASDFKTSGRLHRRPVVDYQPVSGWSVYTVEGESPSIDVTMSAQMILSAENYFASRMAAMHIRQKLSEALTGTGTYLRFASNCRIYPQERFNVMFTVAEAPESGFAEGIETFNSLEDVQIIRNVLAALPEMKISDEELKSYKEYIKTEMSVSLQCPESWLHIIALRYLDGKDQTTNYAKRIDAITPEVVESLLSALGKGSRVEYIIK